MLATTVQAVDQPEGYVKYDPQTEPDGWPWTKTITYDPYEICTIKVKLEVGYFVQIEDCGDIDDLKLKQVICDDSDDFPCYEGCTTFKARANFPAFFGADFEENDLGRDDGQEYIGGNWDIEWDGTDDNEIEGDGQWEDLKICMTAWNVNLAISGSTDGSVTIGKIVITVKPEDEVTSGP